MQLSDFERKLDKKIVTRGRQYYKDGHVDSLEQIGETNWQAEVAGTDIYIVDIVIEDASITFTDCDCPYEAICKHIVAVLYEIKAQLQQPEKPVKKPALKELLIGQSKERLIELIMTVGKRHRDFMRELELEVMPAENEKDMAEKIIQQHLKAGQDRHGFIKYGQTAKALQGIERIQERIDEHIEDDNLDVALELALLCLRYGLEALECGDDSKGDLSGSAEYSIGLIDRIIEGNGWSAIQKKQVFSDVEEMIFSEELAQWQEWQLDLLAACVPLCDNGPCEQQFLTIAQLLENRNQSKWSTDYVAKRIQTLKRELATFSMTDEERERYLQQHPEDTNLRERLIHTAFERLDYGKVLQLADQGLELDGVGHLAFQWKEYAFEAQKALQNEPVMKELAYELLMSGRQQYYGHLKSLYTAQEWEVKREQVLDALKRKGGYLYHHFIVEEKQAARILAYCQQHPHAIGDDYPHLVGIYDEEVWMLFTQLIMKEAKKATNRSHYRAVAQLIAKLKSAGHEGHAADLVEELKYQYSRRPAFIDELGNV